MHNGGYSIHLVEICRRDHELNEKVPFLKCFNNQIDTTSVTLSIPTKLYIIKLYK